jgi:hypothetical protein
MKNPFFSCTELNPKKHGGRDGIYWCVFSDQAALQAAARSGWRPCFRGYARNVEEAKSKARVAANLDGPEDFQEMSGGSPAARQAFNAGWH